MQYSNPLKASLIGNTDTPKLATFHPSNVKSKCQPNRGGTPVQPNSEVKLAELTRIKLEPQHSPESSHTLIPTSNVCNSLTSANCFLVPKKPLSHLNCLRDKRRECFYHCPTKSRVTKHYVLEDSRELVQQTLKRIAAKP